LTIVLSLTIVPGVARAWGHAERSRAQRPAWRMPQRARFVLGGPPSQFVALELDYS
jgi:hypothetical protein